MIRILDLAIGLVALVLFALPMVVIACLIWLDDGGPILFRQHRVGKDRKAFKLYKFRTMTFDTSRNGTGDVTSETKEGKIAARQNFKATLPNDPRITRIGRKIRSSHLDELPQLMNVIKGNMSIVGVRPDTPAQEIDYTAEYWKERHQYRPGITGTAQIQSNVVGLEMRTKFEKLWLDSRSINLYCQVIFRTFSKVLKRNSF